MKILLIEDDLSISRFIQFGLREEGFAVDAFNNGEDGLQVITSYNYSLLILDVMLPGMNGFEVCRIMRQMHMEMPVLMLSGKAQVSDRVEGLDTGADDYLVKPFAFSELMARIRALLRREKHLTPARMQAGALCLNPATREVTFGNREIELTEKEFAVLEYLMQHPDVIATRTVLEQQVWEQDFERNSNIIDVYINRIRSKLGDDGRDLIQSVRGIGYRFKIKAG